MILSVKNITKSFSGLKAVNDVSFEIEKGSITGLIGENGAGKTTLFNVLSGFEKQEAGEIYFEGENISHLSAIERSRKGIGRLFQNPRVFGNISVIDNLLSSTHHHPGEHLWNYVANPLAIRKIEDKNKKKALEILDTCWLKENSDDKAFELSYGQKKWLSLGMAMINDSSLILLDEPYAGLNPASIVFVNKILLDFVAKGITFIIIEHNVKAVKPLCSQILQMSEGKIVTEEKNIFQLQSSSEINELINLTVETPAHYGEQHKPSNVISETIVALDIGTTKIAVFVGRKNEDGKVEILGFGKADSVGVNRGVVTHITPTVDSIRKAVEEAQVKSGEEIREVYVGIAGQHIKSVQSRGMITRIKNDTEISQEDIDKCSLDMYQLTMQPGDKIIDVIPQDFIVDGEMGIKNPIGMAGVRLEANFHIITGQVTAVANIHKCVENAGLRVAGMTLEPLASSEAVLNEEEKEAGVVLVDIGGGTTDIAIFQEKIIRHTAVIPAGGNIITDDIKDGCTILRNHAEKLKVSFGSAMASEVMEHEVVAIPGFRNRAPQEISLKYLAQIIQARMEEIIEQVFYEIKSSGLEKKLIAGIVVTGGGAQLKNISQLFEYITGMDTRIGYPAEHLGKTVADVTHPMYSTGIGLLLKGFNNLEKEETKHYKAKSFFR